MDQDRFDALVSVAALPFVVGMALGLAVGRFAGSPLLGVGLGLALSALLAWARLRLSEVPR